MQDPIINQIIKQETQLLDKVDSPDELAELIDNEFIGLFRTSLFSKRKKHRLEHYLFTHGYAHCNI